MFFNKGFFLFRQSDGQGICVLSRSTQTGLTEQKAQNDTDEQVDERYLSADSGHDQSMGWSPFYMTVLSV
jgi:hypothetical protein